MGSRLGILGSGSGTNMAAIVEACRSGTVPANPVLVLSDVENASILQLATQQGIENRYIPPGPYKTKLSEESEQSFIHALQAANVDWVVLAGFMRIIKSGFLRAFPERIVNIHPSLLPSFPGLNAASQAIAHGVQVTGTTVHLVDQGIDSGAIVAQAPVNVEAGDTPETLHDRIKQVEHRLYPQAIAALVSGDIKIEGRRIVRQ